MNVLKYQHHVCFNDEPKSCLSVSSEGQSIKGHRPKYNSYTDLLSVQRLLCPVVKGSPVHHLSHIAILLALSDQQNCFKNQSCRELTVRL